MPDVGARVRERTEYGVAVTTTGDASAATSGSRTAEAAADTGLVAALSAAFAAAYIFTTAP